MTSRKKKTFTKEELMEALKIKENRLNGKKKTKPRKMIRKGKSKSYEKA